MNSTTQNLTAAMEIARRALDDLPRTPVIAAGYNLRYRSQQPVESLLLMLGSPWDDRLSDSGYTIEARMMSRTVPWREGKIKVFISREPEIGYGLLLNFDLQADDTARLRDRLNVSAEDIRAEAENILYRTIGLTPEEIADA